ncbi:hypothetical protein EOE18_12740 [Novosphingobium umbonatum]|uniref:3'-5' exonuclease n=1 Tax=Novosphingobium umbonatum TaxID=1908524 RepID=A0A437N280_9SPHN|nr:hypothetical protein [Novosphingobium umbonatum]RVU04044.1 hypothetical protein EOE18_12740 [Novosphingobium umbonatum]
MPKFVIFDVETTADHTYMADYRIIDPKPSPYLRDAARRITAAACLAVEINAQGVLEIGRLDAWSWGSVGGEAGVVERLCRFMEQHADHGAVSWSGLAHDQPIATMAAMRHGITLPQQLRLHHRKPSADDQLRGIKVPRYALGPHYDLALAMKGKSGHYCHLAEVLLNLGIPAAMLRHKLWYQNPHTAADWTFLEGHVAQDCVFTGMALASWLAAQGLAKVNPRIAIGQLAAMYAKAGRSQGLVSNRFHKLSVRMLTV